jgi:tetratricopeptide (TPR) repeat protein
MQPVLNPHATSYGLSASGRFRAVAPCTSMESAWHATESKISELYGEQDWRGVLRLEHDALVAAKAIQSRWPEVACGIYSMLADAHFEVGNYDELQTLHQNCLALAEELENSEMEAQALIDNASFQSHIKNYEKAIELIQLSLPKWRAARNSLGEGIAHESLGQLYALQRHYAEAIPHLEPALELARSMGDTLRQEQVAVSFLKFSTNGYSIFVLQTAGAVDVIFPITALRALSRVCMCTGAT